MARFNLLLILIALACALSAVSANHRARKLVTELESVQKRMRDLDVEWGQLQLEQSTWAGHVRVEKAARENLGMKPPAAGQILSVDPVPEQ
ncbi:MAG: cell division protein FtsL [Sulfuritalea sp.]|nr:cell division protein FtsL [Sulfuritalea sp.]